MGGTFLPAKLEMYGGTQCRRCRKIVRIEEVSDSERYPGEEDAWAKHLCKECKSQVDERCKCSRGCNECYRCGGCKMPPCEECEANRHLRKDDNDGR